MITFAFTVLGFVLFALAGLCVCLYLRREIREQQRTERRWFRLQISRAAHRIGNLETGLDHANKIITILNSDKGTKGFSIPNYKESMERRAVDENKKLVIVNDKQQRVG